MAAGIIILFSDSMFPGQGDSRRPDTTGAVHYALGVQSPMAGRPASIREPTAFARRFTNMPGVEKSRLSLG